MKRLQKLVKSLPPAARKHPLKTLKRASMAMLHPERPILVQLVVIRRCNLTCGYCNEYDDHSAPIAKEVLFERIDHLAELGTLALTLTGGEPFLHPDLDALVAHAVSHGMVVTSISNAYPLTEQWVHRMNDAGLSLLQVSVDNIEPNDVSQKSWTKIKKRLAVMREHADFKLNINAVLGSSPPEQARELIGEIRAMGFYQTVGLLHDHEGRIDPGLIGEELPSFYREMRDLCHKSVLHQFGEGWEEKMLRDGRMPYKCRAGARYLYVDEHGAVNYCSQRRGEPGTQLLDYTRADLLREFETPKGCEEKCTIACVRRASSLDEWRPQRREANPPRPDRRVHLPTIQA